MSAARLLRIRLARMVVVLGAMSVVVCWSAAYAELIELGDKNSTITVDTASPLGAHDWFVDDVNQLETQWFWYRVGDGREYSLDNLHLLGSHAVDTDPLWLPGGDPRPDVLVIGYVDAAEVVDRTFQIVVEYSLTGGALGSHTSDLAESSISIQNLTDDEIDFHFFQYADFELDGNPEDQLVEILGGNTAQQSGTGSIFSFSQSVVTPMPDHYEAGVGSSTLDRLNDAGPTDLNDNPTAGPGDLTWAFQWDVKISPSGSPGSTFIISKDKHISMVPEPSTLAMVGIGLLIFGAYAVRRRRRKN